MSMFIIYYCFYGNLAETWGKLETLEGPSCLARCSILYKFLLKELKYGLSPSDITADSK